MVENQNPNQQTILKTRLFGGFDKKQVLFSIDRLREENARAQQELELRMQELSDSRKQFSEQVSGFEQTISQLESQLKESQGKVTELTGTVGTLEKALEGYKKDAADNSRALKIQMEQNRQLTMRAEAFEKKALRYDEFSAQLGDILLEAKAGANDIVNSARSQAETLKGDYARVSKEFYEEAANFKRDILNLKSSINSAVDDMNRRLDSMNTVLDAFMQDASPEESKAASVAAGDSREFF